MLLLISVCGSTELALNWYLITMTYWLVVLQIPSVAIGGGDHSTKFHQSTIRVTREWHDGTAHEDVGLVHRYLEFQPLENVDKVKLSQVSKSRISAVGNKRRAVAMQSCMDSNGA